MRPVLSFAEYLEPVLLNPEPLKLPLEVLLFTPVPRLPPVILMSTASPCRPLELPVILMLKASPGRPLEPLDRTPMGCLLFGPRNPARPMLSSLETEPRWESPRFCRPPVCKLPLFWTPPLPCKLPPSRRPPPPREALPPPPSRANAGSAYKPNPANIKNIISFFEIFLYIAAPPFPSTVLLYRVHFHGPRYCSSFLFGTFILTPNKHIGKPFFIKLRFSYFVSLYIIRFSPDEGLSAHSAQ
jgi:hypothetical protein